MNDLVTVDPKAPNDTELEEFQQIRRRLAEENVSSQELVRMAKSSKEKAALVKEYLSSPKVTIEETELADTISQEIIRDIEDEADKHLRIHNKFTLSSSSFQPNSTCDKASPGFFNLISLIKDVSIVGRKLVEAAPRFESTKPRSPIAELPGNNTHLKDKRGTIGDEATSEDLLAALIESSSGDDFLVLTSSLDSISIRDMIIAAYILVKSHECFTLSHDIQGVAVVLRRAKFMILNILAPRNQMELVTKLLTSIGRYREMNYVFDLFRDRNQFELLLSKGVEKTPELRIALFYYVKKNPEFYALVTLNFSMFREIAESLEASATKRLNISLKYSETKPLEGRGRLKQSESSRSELQGDRKKLSDRRVSQVSLKHELKFPDRLQSRAHRRSDGGRGGGPPDQSERESLSSGISSASNLERASFSVQRLGLTDLLRVGHSDETSDVKPQTGSRSQMEGPEIGKVPSSGSCVQESVVYSEDNLNLSLVELVDASDCYAKAGCYRRSNICENKAKLIALQLVLLSSGTDLLKLKQTDLHDLIVSFESFHNAYILAEAYDYHTAWRQALFTNVILRPALNASRCTEDASSKYLDDFCSKCDLSTALVMELIVLYKKHISNYHKGGNTCSHLDCLPETTSGDLTKKKLPAKSSISLINQTTRGTSLDCCSCDMNKSGVFSSIRLFEPEDGSEKKTTLCDGVKLAAALKMVLARLADIEFRCKMYTQLNFLDAKEELMQDAATHAYLKDLKLA